MTGTSLFIHKSFIIGGIIRIRRCASAVQVVHIWRRLRQRNVDRDFNIVLSAGAREQPGDGAAPVAAAVVSYGRPRIPLRQQVARARRQQTQSHGLFSIPSFLIHKTKQYIHVVVAAAAQKAGR
jgi:hypothetical protein